MRAFIKTLLLGLVFISLIFTCNKFPAFTGTSASFSDTKYANAKINTGIWENLPGLIGVPDINLTGSDAKFQNTTDDPMRATMNSLENFNSSLNNESLAETLGNLTSNSFIAANETLNPTYPVNLTNNTNLTGSANLTDTFDLDRVVSLEEANSSTGSLVSGVFSGFGGGGGFGGSDNDEGILPEAFFSSNVTEGYAPLNVQLTDLSQNATEWKWDFGDGASSQKQNTAHTYSAAGTYIITLDASNSNGTDSQSVTLTVLEPPEVIIHPVADFSSSITRGPVPFSVQFTDLSENATEWKWDFGDGTISTERNPVHIYSATGKYTVTLTVTNEVGTDTKTRTDYINVGIASTVKLTSITLDGENSTGATTNSGALTTNSEDSLGQIGVSDENGVFFNQPSHNSPFGEIFIPLQLGINNFSLIADGIYPENKNYGVVLFFDGVQTPPQVAVYNSNDGTGTFSVQPTGTEITGSANGGLSLDKAPGSSVYIAPDGTKIEVVSFVVDSKNKFIDKVSGEDTVPNEVPDTTAKISLKVTPSSILPLASFSASTLSGTVPLNVSFTDSSQGSPTSWNWDFGDGNISTEQSP
ncbi:MAG TPA: PKD domain-containing protein, partial [Methanosarcina sp.]|nr:PKD domain-containing protein [Methanosarcina sp.]